MSSRPPSYLSRFENDNLKYLSNNLNWNNVKICPVKNKLPRAQSWVLLPNLLDWTPQSKLGFTLTDLIIHNCGLESQLVPRAYPDQDAGWFYSRLQLRCTRSGYLSGYPAQGGQSNTASLATFISVGGEEAGWVVSYTQILSQGGPPNGGLRLHSCLLLVTSCTGEWVRGGL